MSAFPYLSIKPDLFTFYFANMRLIILGILLLSHFNNQAQQFVGSWKADLDVLGQKLPLILHIENKNGQWLATTDSPKQGVSGLQTEINISDHRFDVLVAGIIKIKGVLHADSLLEAKFEQGNFKSDLTFHRTTKLEHPTNKPKNLRSQDPMPPYTYNEDQFILEFDNCSLAGTINSPLDSGKYPAVILISGSGQQNRDGELFNHRPFRVLADHLVRNGIVVLRFDDIGMGYSKGDLHNLTTQSQADDVELLLEHLLRFKQVDSSRVGLIGHSEGGIIAPIIAARNPHVKFMVSLAGMAIDGHELLERQRTDNNIFEGMSVDKQELYSQLFAKLKDGTGSDKALLKQMNDLIQSFPKKEELTLRDTTAFNQLFTPWLINFMRIKPAEYLTRIKIPMLLLNGEKDVQVIAKENLARFEKHLPAHPHHTFKTYPDLNHLFQTAETGAVSEYAEIEETFNEGVMNDIVRWINKL